MKKRNRILSLILLLCLLLSACGKGGSTEGFGKSGKSGIMESLSDLGLGKSKPMYTMAFCRYAEFGGMGEHLIVIPDGHALAGKYSRIMCELRSENDYVERRQYDLDEKGNIVEEHIAYGHQSDPEDQAILEAEDLRQVQCWDWFRNYYDAEGRLAKRVCYMKVNGSGPERTYFYEYGENGVVYRTGGDEDGAVISDFYSGTCAVDSNNRIIDLMCEFNPDGTVARAYQDFNEPGHGTHYVYENGRLTGRFYRTTAYNMDYSTYECDADRATYEYDEDGRLVREMEEDSVYPYIEYTYDGDFLTAMRTLNKYTYTYTYIEGTPMPAEPIDSIASEGRREKGGKHQIGNEEPSQETVQETVPEVVEETAPPAETVHVPDELVIGTFDGGALELFFWWSDTYPDTNIVRQLEIGVNGTTSDGKNLMSFAPSDVGYYLVDDTDRELGSVYYGDGFALVELYDSMGSYEISITDGVGYVQYMDNGVHNVEYTINRGGEELRMGNTDDTEWMWRYPTGIWGLMIQIVDGEISQ